MKSITRNNRVSSLKADRRQRVVSEQKPYTICLRLSCMVTHTRACMFEIWRGIHEASLVPVDYPDVISIIQP